MKREQLLAALNVMLREKKTVLLVEKAPGSGMRLVSEVMAQNELTVFCVQGMAQLSPAAQIENWRVILDHPIASVVIVRKGDNLGNPALTNKMIHLAEDGA